MVKEKRILLIDDDAHIREMYCKALTRQGYIVSLAINGKEALEILNKLKPNLIISDYNMPVMDGFSFLKELRAFDPETPVIILTGASGESVENEARKLGANSFLNKGMGIGSFIQEVFKFTAQKQTIVNQ